MRRILPDEESITSTTPWKLAKQTVHAPIVCTYIGVYGTRCQVLYPSEALQADHSVFQVSLLNITIYCQAASASV